MIVCLNKNYFKCVFLYIQTMQCPFSHISLSITALLILQYDVCCISFSRYFKKAALCYLFFETILPMKIIKNWFSQHVSNHFCLSFTKNLQKRSGSCIIVFSNVWESCICKCIRITKNNFCSKQSASRIF